MNFRYDINGLRAIAVIAVVLFHFNPVWVPGGFAGVDVFFVISGFLMTSLIFRGLENNDFNLFKFYVARANRIIPALAVLCLVLMVFGWFYLFPFDYRALGKHVASSMGFISNVIYWRESGYFDAASHDKWLLHTWSLSVEWQFYILYPIVLVALKKFLSLENLKRLIVIGTILGFVFSVIATIKWPNSAYYLIPTRAWEMMMGGVAFLYPWSLSKSKKKAVEFTGLALIIGSYVFISSDILWPGHFALLPVLGAYLMIVSNQQSSFITNNILFQCLGKWSYSIYLWHWPIVVFGHYFDVQMWALYGLPLSIVLGFISFKLVEGFKFKAFSSWLEVFKVKPMYMMMVLGLSSTFLWVKDGYLYQVDENINKTLSFDIEEEGRQTWALHNSLDKKESFVTENKRILVIGDSQAGDFVNVLSHLDEYTIIELATKVISWDCGIFYVDDSDLIGFLSSKNNTAFRGGENGTKACPEKMNRAFNSKLVSQADYIFIAQQWRSETLPYIMPALLEMKKKTEAKVILVGNKDLIRKPSSSIVYESYITGSDIGKISRKYIDYDKLELNNLIESEVRKSQSEFLNVMSTLCSDSGCLVFPNKKLAFYNLNHTTEEGSYELWKRNEKQILSLVDLP